MLLEAGLREGLEEALIASALAYGRWDSTRLLLEAGADPTAPSVSPSEERPRPWTARVWAMYNGHHQTLRELRSRAQRDLADAVIDDDLEAVEGLLARGASPGLELANRQTPLTCAARLGHLRVLLRLLEAGADPDRHSPWKIALERGWIDCVQALEAAGASVSGALPFVEARSRAPLRSFRWALDREPPEELSAHLLKTMVPERLSLLLERGASVEAETTGGFTPLMRCAQHRRAEALRLLIEAGADVHAVDREGRNAMDWAFYDPEFPEEPLELRDADREEPAVALLLAAGLPLPKCSPEG
jgi:ankyrin repeat protein